MRVPFYIRHPEVREYYQIEWMKIIGIGVGSCAIALIPVAYGFSLTELNSEIIVPSEATLWQDIGSND
ncbi:MAG TPA: hypothetical protein ACFE0H_02220 [Elainellaceae cyanobacterium]